MSTQHTLDWYGFVYFISAPTLGLVKIGYSRKSPDARFAAIQACSPATLERLAYMEGCLEDEQFLHEKFYADHHHYEWFRLSDAIRAYVAENTHPWPTPPRRGDWTDEEFAEEREHLTCRMRERVEKYGDNWHHFVGPNGVSSEPVWSMDGLWLTTTPGAAGREG